MRKFVMQLVYTGAGSLAGYLYWQFAGSKSGEGFITSSLVFSIFFGAIIGFLLWGNILYAGKFRKNNPNSLSHYKHNKSIKKTSPSPLIHID